MFTGGNLTLINNETGEVHPYYSTAKKVIEYAIKSKKERGIDFPILAICQGFELLGIFASEDRNVLKEVECIGKQRVTEWHKPVDQVRTSFRTFRDFDQEIIERMAAEPHVVHFHKWGFPLADFEESKHFTSFFNLISCNTLDSGLKFPTAYEAKEFPFFCVLYHPEYNMVLNKNDTTLRIANSFSELINKEASAHVAAVKALPPKEHKYRVMSIAEGMTRGEK